MKTPKEFINNLNRKIVTEEMLENVLYSLNKRAKNCRDKKNEYYYIGKDSNPYSTYKDYAFKNVEKYKEKENEYYSKKDFLILKLLEPICIHNFGENKFLYFETTNFSFHLPFFSQNLKQDYLKKYTEELQEIELKEFNTSGKDISDLLSTQFCDKVIGLIKNGDYSFIESHLGLSA